MSDHRPGNIETPIGRIAGVNVTLTSMAPEARDCLDQAMEQWREWRARQREAGLVPKDSDEVYAFAYWLLRHSGLVVPA